MGLIIDAGFDVPRACGRLEAWWTEHVACPVMRPGGPNERVTTLMELHWGEHGLPMLVKHDGKWVPAPRCSEPCPALGVALARLEIRWFGITVLEIEEFLRLEMAASILLPSDPLHAECVRKGNDLAAHFVSRAAVAQCLYRATGGRPETPLALAVAQHLRRGGFKPPAIAELIGCTVEAARQRSTAASRRSLRAFAAEEQPTRLASARLAQYGSRTAPG